MTQIFPSVTASRHILVGIAGAFGLLAASPAAAEVRQYKARLVGDAGTTVTGSKAVGDATVTVDLVTRKVSIALAVDGLTIESLWDRLVAAPIGPIHLHRYGARNHQTGGYIGDSELALPLPFGPTYVARAGGFSASMRDYDYVAGAAALNSTLGFDDFVNAMDSGLIIVNVHTDAHNDGEISGVVTPI